MKKSFCTVVALILPLSAPALASAHSNAVYEQLVVRYPAPSPYEVLKNLFEDSRSPVKLSDLDLATDATSNQRCVHAFQESKTPATGYAQRWEIKRDAGPLFPPVSYLIEANDRGRVAKQGVIEELFSGATLSLTPTEITQTIRIPRDAFSPIVMRLRKSADLVAIQFTENDGSPSARVIYLYCYRK